MGFDVDGALKAGFTQQDIDKYLGNGNNQHINNNTSPMHLFDIEAAIIAGSIIIIAGTIMIFTTKKTTLKKGFIIIIGRIFKGLEYVYLSIAGIFVMVIGAAMILIPIAAWGFSIVHHLSNNEWGMLLVAGLIPPIGVIDGIGLFFGWWG